MALDPHNSIITKMRPEQIEELQRRGLLPATFSASQPNEEPMARRTAKGKSLTSSQSQQIKVSGTTSALRTRPSNNQKDKQGMRQVTRYHANKIATTSLVITSTNQPVEPTPKEEIVRRTKQEHLYNQPVIINNRPVR